MLLRRLSSTEYKFHLLLWVFFLLSLVADVYPAYQSDPARFFIYVFSKTMVIAALVYTHLWFFHPLLFRTRRYILFVLAGFVLCAIAGLINTYLEIYMSPSLAGRAIHVIPGQFTMALRYLLIAFLLQITADYYQQKETIRRIEVAKINAELNFLKAQVHPHFLFNTLNNLYALALQKSDKTADSILKLADIMKYILSEGKEEKVSLEKEIELIHNYTDLEKIRKADAEITFEVTGDVHNINVTPLLLLPLVENAFKHGLNTVSRNGFVHLQVKAHSKQLIFSVENNKPPAGNRDAVSSLGIGIANVKQRLDILYPGKYKLDISENSELFSVVMQLDL